jgi:H+/Cl- antiporter ClcA
MQPILKLVGPALVILGLWLLYLAYKANESAAGQLSEAFSGSPSDRTWQYGIAGVVCLLLGLGGGFKAFRVK